MLLAARFHKTEQMISLAEMWILAKYIPGDQVVQSMGACCQIKGLQTSWACEAPLNARQEGALHWTSS